MTQTDETIASPDAGTPAEPAKRYTYRRGSDGVDDTWDIYDPDDRFVVSIRFWDEPDGHEAAETEARARLIVETLNKGYRW
jgi:hypothetical protein